MGGVCLYHMGNGSTEVKLFSIGLIPQQWMTINEAL